MKQTKRSIVVWTIVILIAFFSLAGGAFYYLHSKADASVNGGGTICPLIQSYQPGWCSDGTITSSSPTPDGCPMPPTCVRTQTPTPSVTSVIACGANGTPCISPTVTSTTACGAGGCSSPVSTPTISTGGNQITYNLSHGFNIIVIPESMFSSTEPVSSSAFTDAGMTIYNYSNGNWQLNPQYFRRMGSYIVKNPNNAVTITVNGSLHILNGVYNGQIVYKGWNTLANNSDSAKLLSEMNFRTYLNVPECTQPLCGDYKSMAQLLSDNRIYSRIYLFNDLTSADPNVFYATKILSSADLNNYKIPAHAGFWMYLFQ